MGKKLVEISAEDMANKELKEWRQAELKQDIEKIKSHELDLLQMGSKIVLKTHKGEEVKEQEKTEIKLPEVLIMPDTKKSSRQKLGIMINMRKKVKIAVMYVMVK